MCARRRTRRALSMEVRGYRLTYAQSLESGHRITDARRHTHASNRPASIALVDAVELTYSCNSSRALALVTLSFLLRFLSATTRWGSAILVKSGCSAIYERDDGAVWKPAEGGPKPKEDDPNAAEAARALEACDLNFLLMLPRPASM